MPFYVSLRREPAAVRRRAASRLAALRAQLASIPARTIEETLLLASWNLREFDSGKYGPRCAECFFYIAEIVSRFDLVAIQEVREDLAALDRLQSILGGWWKYVVTDVTEGSAGNGERMAFLFDSRKVTFGGLAGEIVLPEPRGTKGERRLQFARTPFLCGFKAGWSKFNLCTVHIYYGKDRPEDPRRVQEIRDLAALLARRAKKSAQPARPEGAVTAVRNTDAENLILLGDFNIYNHDDATMGALEEAGFVIPAALRGGEGSNLSRERHYDQIALYPRTRRFAATGKAGVFDFTRSVFRDDDEKAYASMMGEKYAAKTSAQQKSRYYRDWRTHQMSDHLLLWAELAIGFADERLADLARDHADSVSG